MPKHSALLAWLDRRDPLSSFIDLDTRSPQQEWGGFLTLDVVVPVHESLNLESESLEKSWHLTHDYIEKSLEIIRADEPLWLDSEEVEMIKSKLCDPPLLCYPIYIISIESAGIEQVIYIGKTSSSKGRFIGGHAALTKLLDPKYDGIPKRLYLGALVLLAEDKSYQPLEWVKPLEKAEQLLKSIESQLIYEFKPELNDQHVNSFNSKWPVSIHIQNFTGVTDFLHDKFCWPP
jgi:hypothetical protein